MTTDQSSAPEPDPATSSDPLLTYDDVVRMYRVPKGTLYFWVARGLIPHVRLGPRSVRFQPEALRRWLEHREGGR